VRVELGQAREAAHNQRENAGGHGVEGTEVSDGALAQNTAGAGNYIVRGEARGFIDDDDGVHLD